MTLEGKALETAVTGLVGIGVKVFGKFLEDDSLKSVEQKIYKWSETYTRKYLKRHGQIQVLGMSQAISLDDIYTNVRMLDAETVKRLESIEGLEKVYREASQRGFGKRESAKQKGMEVANAEQYLCVLGGPGIGKTTYLRKVGLEALLRKVGSYNHEKIPVFLELKRFRDPDLDIKTCIVKEFETCGFPDPEKFTEHALKSGDLLILLDGLDEVPSNNLEVVIESINDFSVQYSENRFIASCRIAAYRTYNYFTGYKTVAIAEFNDDQILDFITNWFQADPNPNMTLKEKAEDATTCWEQLKSSNSIGTKELSQTPLLLTFVCLTFRQNKTIADNRANLYSKALDILLDEWAKSKCLQKNWKIYQDLNIKLERDMLAEIAHAGFEKDKLFFEKNELAQHISVFLTDNLNAPKYLDVDGVIDAIAVQQGIFIERATDVYSFSHLTLQEYLCAEYIRDWNCEDQLAKNHATDERWREVFLLVTGLKGRAAIGFLQQLEARTQELSKYRKLKGLLTWADIKTSNSASNFSCEIKRVITLQLIFDLARARTLDIAGDLARASDLSLSLARDLSQTRTFARDHVHALSRDLVFANDLTLVLTRARIHAKFISEYQIISEVDIQPLISYLTTSMDHEQVFVEELTDIISSSFYISLELLDLSSDDVQAITNYLSTCQLMIDCSKQASGLSMRDWNAIQQRMFLPPKPQTPENSSSI